MQLRILQIISTHPEYDNHEISKALKIEYLLKVDYRTVAKYRIDVENILKEVEARLMANIEMKMKDENLLNTIWSRLLRKQKKQEVIIDG